jgi:FG-GAP-like repeat
MLSFCAQTVGGATPLCVLSAARQWKIYLVQKSDSNRPALPYARKEKQVKRRILCSTALLVAYLIVTCHGSSEAGPAELFRHHFIATDIPMTTDTQWGFGTPVLADFDRDGDLDFAVSVRDEKMFWYENRGTDNWVRHEVGDMPVGQLGAAALDVDHDGWTDIVTGGYWFRNLGAGGGGRFRRLRYDPAIAAEVHDVVVADVDGDGRPEVVIGGDQYGCAWYKIPANPTGESRWPKHMVTLAPLKQKDRIHGGLSPGGVKDLDGDGDADIVMTDRWLENRGGGTEWVEHKLPFGKRGPYGLSSRAWIADINQDGHNDIVMTDSDQQESRAAWLESDGKRPPTFKIHWLPNSVPGVRGSFHSLAVADFDGDGDLDILTAEQEDLLPKGSQPRWFLWENTDGRGVKFVQRVIFNGRLGGHDIIVGDIDGDGDLDVVSKIWKRWPGNANGDRFHADWFENLRIKK